MYAPVRQEYNAGFTDEKYQRFLDDLQSGFNEPIAFRIAETPVFLSDEFRDQLIKAGDEIIETILQPDFKALTEGAIPKKWNIPNENGHPHFIALDFGVCKDSDGKLVPKLIELQGFPSLFGFQVILGDKYRQSFDIGTDWTIYFNGLDKARYVDLLKKTIVGNCDPTEVVLMDVDACHQKTNVDFFATQNLLGIPIVALEDLIEKEGDLYHKTENGLQKIKRVYNRLIFDEIENNAELLNRIIDLKKPLNVEWVTHPNWFYRISKYTMPFLKSGFIPQTHFLNEVDTNTLSLENYVLKPLFSFAGQGVIIDVTQGDLNTIDDPHNWILQQKVDYEPAIQSPSGGVKAEIRLLYLWPDGDEKPTLAINLARLSRGKMIGVRYNQDFDWVGGTVAFMQK